MEDILPTLTRATEEVELEVGRADLPPWDDYNLGLILGRLSALDWVRGGELKTDEVVLTEAVRDIRAWRGAPA